MMHEERAITYPVWRDEKKHWISRNYIVGAFAMWAVRQSPYAKPEGLGNACLALRDFFAHGWNIDNQGFLTYTGEILQKRLENFFKEEESIRCWNDRKNERDGPAFCSRYDTPDPDNSFIDLDALARNITHTLLLEALYDELT